MPVTQILLLRHGHRIAWTLDPTTGKYSSSHPYPSRLPADPPLASHGVRQANETGDFLARDLQDLAREGRLRIYSSLFYRCLETLRPTVEGLRRGIEEDVRDGRISREEGGKLLKQLEVRGERGVSEWFGRAFFDQPVPGRPTCLKERFFDWVDDQYESLVVPERKGERIGELHDRIAMALQMIVKSVDQEFERMGRGKEDVTVLICGHAAQIIASGRALTGEFAGDYDEEDFRCYTCGISRFVRRKVAGQKSMEENQAGEWRTNGGVAGGWDCVQNSDCSHLSQGEERGWHFHGDESFDSYGPGMLKTSDGGLGEGTGNGGRLGSKL